MSDEQPPSPFVPELWANAITASLKSQPRLYSKFAARALREDQRLHREHPWRWRALHTRRWMQRGWRRAARYIPFRWVGFGKDWDLWDDL